MTLNSSSVLEAVPPVMAAQSPVLPDFDREVYCILGLPFDRVSLQQATRTMQQASAQGRRCFLSTPNLNFAIACLDDPKFRLSVIQSDLSVVDGMPLVWIARALGLPFAERVAGSSLFQSLRHGAGKDGAAPMRVYFFGGPPGVAQAASGKLNADETAMQVVGFDSPGFGSIEQMSDPATIARINASGADFLVVALGAKKGQAWIQHNLGALRVPLVSHLGAVVNFVAGTVSRAPVWAQRTGLEWVWRIKEEPKLWRRYWDDGRNFLGLVIGVVIPGALAARRNRVAAARFDTAGMTLRTGEGDCELILTGAIGEANIVRLRKVLGEAARAGGPMVVDCVGLTYIDSAALGSLMLLYGACVSAGRAWAMINPSAELRRSVEFHCAQYLLRPLS